MAVKDSHAAFLLLVGELAFVGILAAIADTSDQTADIILILVVGMWLVFFAFNAASFAPTLAKFTGQATPSVSNPGNWSSSHGVTPGGGLK